MTGEGKRRRVPVARSHGRTVPPRSPEASKGRPSGVAPEVTEFTPVVWTVRWSRTVVIAVTEVESSV